MCTRAALLDLLYLDLDLRRVSPSERLLYLGACSIVTAGTARAMYNVFRLTGDGLHCLALIVLFAKMNATRSCAGARSTDTEPSAGGLSALSRSSAELMQPRARALPSLTLRPWLPQVSRSRPPTSTPSCSLAAVRRSSSAARSAACSAALAKAPPLSGRLTSHAAMLMSPLDFRRAQTST